MKPAAVSVDLDPCAGSALYERALPRWLEKLEAADIKATFFCVGSELRHPTARAALRRAAAAGHEIANHTLDHREPFAALDDATQRRQIVESGQRLSDALGVPIAGFRAPAWDIDARALRTLEELDYAYDSSVCSAWATPWLRLAARAVGRAPGFGDARVALAPAAPYHPSAHAPWRRGDMRLVEVPTSVGAGGVMFWFSPVLAAGFGAIRALGPFIQAAPAPQWLCHGIDLLDFERDADPALAWRPGLRRPIAEKLAMVDAIFEQLRRWFTVGTVAALAAHA